MRFLTILFYLLAGTQANIFHDMFGGKDKDEEVDIEEQVDLPPTSITQGAFSIELIPPGSNSWLNGAEEVIDEAIVEAYIENDDDYMELYDVEEGELSDAMMLPGYDMTVAEFEAILEAIYGVEVDIELEYQIEGWAESNNTLRAFYICCLVFGILMFIFSVIIIFLNELKFKRLHNVWWLFNHELITCEGGKTEESNHNKLIFAQGGLSIVKKGGL